MFEFRLLGFPVRVHWFFWVNAALLGGALSADSPRALQALLVWMVAVFVSILIHELGHALTMRKFGDRSPHILLYALGGLAYGSGYRTRNEQILISAAGPALQIGVGVGVYLLARAIPDPAPLVAYGLYQFVFVSVFWGALNLAPIYPLDGGQIAAASLGPSRIRLALRISLVFAIGIGLWVFLSFGSIIAPLFFGMMAYNNWRQLRNEPEIPWMGVR